MFKLLLDATDEASGVWGAKALTPERVQAIANAVIWNFMIRIDVMYEYVLLMYMTKS